ncbi:alpha-2,8-polysialyltransferase family protein [Pelagibacteraceae bacterium]|nr:alpha-2,8-polysialyltransferase family protein [Pelagibacteraceae bacterium]
MKFLNKNSNILFVCHDAGAGNILLDFIQNKIHKKYKYTLFLSGPSKKIYKNSHKNLKYNKTNFKYNENYNIIITGSSFPSLFEHKFRLIYKHNSKIKIISLVDNWRNLKQRFFRNNQYSLPDLFIVNDSKTKLLLNKKFPLIKSILIENDYVKNQLKLIKNSSFKQQNLLLYLSEPIQFKYKGKIINQIYILNNFLKNINKFKLNKNYKIIIKLHPREKIYKYLLLIKKFSNLNLSINIENNLPNLIAQSKIVVGFQTSALYIALKSGCRVYTSNPFKKKKIIIEDINLLKMTDL